MKQGHTPGDWQLNLARYPNGKLAWRPFIYAVGAPVNERHVAELFLEDPNVDANGRLIAAAPKLRATVEAFLAWGREHTSPRDDNSPHELLVAAAALLASIDGEPS